MAYVLFDIGGTKTRVAVSDDLQTFDIDSVVKFTTPDKPKDAVALMVKAVKSLTKEPIRGALGGIRGTLSGDRLGLAHDTVLVDWVDVPFAELLGDALKTTVYLENDAALAGLGEAHFGAGVGYELLVYHTISTGVGGVKIEYGKIDDYSTGFEPGQQILDIDHTILGEDVPPTLEKLVSGSAVKERMGVEPYEIAQGDAIWNQLAYYLAHGLRNTILYWSPDVIVLGGAMVVGNPRILLDDITKHTNDVLQDVAPCPLILDAKLGDVGALYGAMVRLGEIV